MYYSPRSRYAPNLGGPISYPTRVDPLEAAIVEHSMSVCHLWDHVNRETLWRLSSFLIYLQLTDYPCFPVEARLYPQFVGLSGWGSS